MSILYLSHLTLNPASRAVQRDLGNPYNLHRTVMRGFPDDLPHNPPHSDPGRILYRLEQQPHTGQPVLLVQSTLPPAWSALPDSYLTPSDPFAVQTHPNPATKELDTAVWQLNPSRTLRFRLRANPTKRLSSGKGNKPGKRIELYKEDDQLDWLQRQADRHGFRLLTADITPHGKETDWVKDKQNNKKRHKLTLFTVQYDGLLHITDADKFHHALMHGIGPAKAFGCGLLSLAPAG